MNKFLIATILFVAMLSSKAEARNGKFSAGVQFASNWYRNGIAARLDYDFSHRLRLSIDGAYYLTAENTMDIYERTTKVRTGQALGLQCQS